MTKLVEHLQTLEKFDLIGLQMSEADLEYAFKHVFTQESVYQSLLRTDRRQLHQQVTKPNAAIPWDVGRLNTRPSKTCKWANSISLLELVTA